MAGSFDRTQAATDLKLILKVQDEVRHVNGLVEQPLGRADPSHPTDGASQELVKSQQEASVSSSCFSNQANTNGNALLVAAPAKQPTVVQSRKDGNNGQGSSSELDDSKGKQNGKVRSSEESKSNKASKSSGAQLERSKDTKKGKAQKNSVSNTTPASNSIDLVSSSLNKNSSSNNEKNMVDEPIGRRDIDRRQNQFSNRGANQGQNLGRSSDEANWRNQMGPGQQSGRFNNGQQSARLRDTDLPPEFLIQLEENKIHIMKKKSVKFPRANFFCHLCDYHLDLQEDCDKHMKEARHIRRKEIHESNAVLRNIPAPTESQLVALTAAVEKVYQLHGISTEEQSQRAEAVSRLEKVLKVAIPDVMLHMYGSSLTGFGLKSSDVNVDLSSEQNKKLTALLKEIFLFLENQTDCGFSNIRSDFSAKIPGVLLMDDATGLTLNVTIHCYSPLCSSQLLSIYSDFDTRVRKLAVAFRYWAHLCGLDRQRDGFLPPYSFSLMVIYFLQNVSPQVVPIIQPPKVSGDEVGDYKKDESKFKKMRAKVLAGTMVSKNTMEVGELWLQLLTYYCLDFESADAVISIRSSETLSRQMKPWNTKKLAVEDPYMLKKNITRMSNNTSIYEYWQDSIRKALLYFSSPSDQAGNSVTNLSLLKRTLKDAGKGSQGSDKKKEASKISITLTSGVTGRKVEVVKEIDDAQNGNTKCVSIAPNPLLANRKSLPINNGTILKIGSVGDRPSCQPSLPNSDAACQARLGVNNPNSDSKEQSQDRHEPPTLINNPPLPSYIAVNDATSSGKSDTNTCSDQVTPDKQSVKPSLPDLTTGIDPGGDNKSAVGGAAGTSCCAGLLQLANDFHSGQPTDEDIDSFANRYAQFVLSKAVHHLTVSEAGPYGSQTKETNEGRTSSHSVPPPGEGRSSQESETPTKISLPAQSAKRSEASPLSDVGKSPVTSQVVVDELASQIISNVPGVKETGKDILDALLQRNCVYEFSEKTLTNGKGPTLVCSFCEKEGHMSSTCPEDQLPEVLPLPALTSRHIEVLTETLNKVPGAVGLSEASYNDRQMFLKSLEDFIQVQFKGAKLALFGSSCNGFGFDQSDMDICLTFTQRKEPDKAVLVESLAKKLKQHPDLTRVQAIPTAKVPIVKFTVRKNELEGDISLYNILAQQNTKLLLSYSRIDPRVSILGYTIKTFAKVCDIGDASRGSLSSYAYVLMMLYYLQQVKPPVIPVLQELYKGDKKPEMMVEGWDAWFMEDLSQLDEMWPEKGQNTTSVAELWLGFLCFYIEEFNIKEHVVSIRQKELLTRFDKLWNGSCLAIEDPFDLSHNLGSGLTRKMNNFIMKTFINGRMLYGSPIDDNMEIFNKYQSPSDYFFDTDLLSECRPVNVRGCRKCGKIGHLVRHCPMLHKERDEDQRKQQQQQQQQQQQTHGQKQQPQLAGQKQQQSQGQKPQLPLQVLGLLPFPLMLPQQQQASKQPQQQQSRQRGAAQPQIPPLLMQQLAHGQSMALGQPLAQNLFPGPRPQQRGGPAPRNERERWDSEFRHSDHNGNLNRNRTGPAFNLTSHPSLHPVIPSALRGRHPGMNAAPMFNPHHQQQQQPPHSPQRGINPVQPPPSYMSPPATPPRQGFPNFNYSSPPPRASQPQLVHPPPSYPTFPHQNNNNNQRLPQSSPRAGQAGNFQGMNPNVQNLFDHASRNVVDVTANHAYRRK